MTEEERRRLKAVQDAIKASGTPDTPEEVQLMFQRMMAAATGKPVDTAQRAEKIELAQKLAKWIRK